MDVPDGRRLVAVAVDVQIVGRTSPQAASFEVLMDRAAPLPCCARTG